MQRSFNPSQCKCSFWYIYFSDYEALKQKKVTLQKEKDKVTQEVSSMKLKVWIEFLVSFHVSVAVTASQQGV